MAGTSNGVSYRRVSLSQRLKFAQIEDQFEVDWWIGRVGLFKEEIK
jgi:hypothetical protein